MFGTKIFQHSAILNLGCVFIYFVRCIVMDISGDTGEESFKSLKDFTEAQKSEKHEAVKKSMDEIMIADAAAGDDDKDLTAHVGGEHLGFNPEDDGGVGANITSDVG